MKKIIFLILVINVLQGCFFDLDAKTSSNISNKLDKNLVLSTQKIILKEFPDAFNPSIIQTDFGYILTFRYCPDRSWDGISYLGIVKLNTAFKPISTPQILDSCFRNSIIQSQTEDPRIFSLNGKLYLIYNDNREFEFLTAQDRRDMFIAELHESNGSYFLRPPLKLIHEDKYSSVLCQKNWVPFEWNGMLLLGYSVSPHEVLAANLETGACYPISITPLDFQWKNGVLSGGTPAQLVDGKYLAFFHSKLQISSSVSHKKKMYHYFMGAYTFSDDPPFSLIDITPSPIIGKDFYTKSKYDKRVVFPCGFVVSGNYIYVSYGKDDREIWIAIIDKKSLEKSMVPAS